MADGATVPFTRTDEALGALVDLTCAGWAKALDLDDADAKRWRTEVAKELGVDRVIFMEPARRVVREHGGESVLPGEGFHLGPQTGELYTPSGLRDLVDRENRTAMDLLVAQVRSPMSVVPFVGAGLSMAFGFPSWDTFLTEAARFHSAPERVLEKVQASRLIDAATLLYQESPDRFQRLVARSFGGPVGEDQVRAGPVGLLPMIASGPLITTNFDHVLETAFRAAGAPFERVVIGQEADNVIRAMHRNERTLIKLHGDASDRSARVFTGLEYDRQYGDGTAASPTEAVGIPKLARIMFTNRPLLFLGCSLDKDRTLDVLRVLHEDLPGLTHYGVLAAPYTVAKLRERRLELDGYGISPLWFAPGDFRRIEGLLQELLQEASTRLLWRNPTPEGAWPTPVPRAAVPETPRVSGEVASGPSDRVGAVARRLAQRIVDGRFAFFLGAGAHLDLVMSARRFYRSLAEDYLFNEEDSQRAEVAQFIVDREGKPEAWAAARQRLSSGGPPSVVIEFLAELPGQLRRVQGAPARQWFLTTNYDTVLEHALAERDERFHLLYYQVDGHWQGHFVHRDLDGSVRIIERPQNFPVLAGGHVVVKLDGGIAWDPRIPETVALAPQDFSISAGRLPSALPQAVRDVLLGQSLLVLGSSLRDAHVQRLIRWSAGDRRAIKTWAVMYDASPTFEQYWSAAGVELIKCDLRDFIPRLRAHIGALVGGR